MVDNRQLLFHFAVGPECQSCFPSFLSLVSTVSKTAYTVAPGTLEPLALLGCVSCVVQHQAFSSSFESKGVFPVTLAYVSANKR